MSHKPEANGQVVRVVDFVEYEYKFNMFDPNGNMTNVPDALYREFFFQPKYMHPHKDHALVQVVPSKQMQETWQNKHYWDSKFLDLKIKDRGVQYEINVPIGLAVDVIPLTGQISTPATSRSNGAILNRDNWGQVATDEYKETKICFKTDTDDVRLVFLLKRV